MQLKLVVTGAYAAGKTQFIRSVSEIDVVDTDVAVLNEVERELKDTTTVGLDFGILTISAEHRLYLFGTPGQKRFDFMWDQLAEGCLGYVVVVDSCRPGQFVETNELIAYFQRISTAPWVVAANKQDDPSALPPAYIRRRLNIPSTVPVLPCVATDPASVSEVLVELMDLVLTAQAEQETLPLRQSLNV